MRATWLLALLLVSCARPGEPPAPAAAAAVTMRGWYGDGRFQPCGEPARRLADTASLEYALRGAGLSPPVYLRIEATPDADGWRLRRVLQRGSTTPVRDCAMTGTSQAR